MTFEEMYPALANALKLAAEGKRAPLTIRHTAFFARIDRMTRRADWYPNRAPAK